MTCLERVAIEDMLDSDIYSVMVNESDEMILDILTDVDINEY